MMGIHEFHADFILQKCK